MINAEDYSRHAERSLEHLNRALDVVADAHEVEIVYQSNVLTVEVEEPFLSKIIVSPNSSALQIWISAQSTSFKLDWSNENQSFVLTDTNESLNQLLGRLIGEALGVEPFQL